MKRKSQLLLLITLVLIQVSCKRELKLDDSTNKKNEQLSLPPGTSVDETNAIWDQRSHEVARIMALLLRGQHFRDYLKSKTLEEFDGDYDVLLSVIATDIVASQGTVQPLVTADNYISEADIRYLQSSSEDFPQMQISVQVDAEAWNTRYNPAVVFTPSDYDEHSSPRVPVVDEKGGIAGYMDATIDPTDPVVIVSMNERTDIIDERVVLRQDARPYGTEGAEKVDSLQPIDPNAPLLWYRQNQKYETIYSFGFWDIGRIEGWPAGGPELRTYHYSATDTVGINYQREGYYAGETWAKRKNVKNKWYDLPNEKLITTHLWRWGQTGTVFKFGFYEFDHEPFNQPMADSLAGFLTKFAKVDSTGNLATPLQLAATAVQIVGLFLPKAGRLSETIGDLEISANNNAEEFHLGTGAFGFRSKAY